jgi:F0F1-type ATP synthase assembly protein I
MSSATLIMAIKFAVALAAAIIVGNWFLAEAKKYHEKKEPWFKVYFTLPGMLIIAALILPVLLWLWQT